VRARKSNDQELADIPTKKFSLRMNKMLALMKKLPNQGQDLSKPKHGIFELMIQFSTLDAFDMWEYYLEPLTQISDVRTADVTPLLQDALIWQLLDNQVKALKVSFFAHLFLLPPHKLEILSNDKIQELIYERILTFEAASSLKDDERKKLVSNVFFNNMLKKNITYEDTKLIYPTITEEGMNNFISSKKVHEQLRELITAVRKNIQEKTGDKYALIAKIGNHMISNNYNDNNTLALHFKNYFYVILQRDRPGFSNKTTTGTLIRTLLNTPEYQDLRHLLFGDGVNHVQYRQIRSYVCGENNTRLFGFCQKRNTYQFFNKNNHIDVGSPIIKNGEEIEAHINSFIHK
jgi:hypothetical protein